MLFVDFNSAFNSITLIKLIGKLSTLGLKTTLCNWILDFLTNKTPDSSDWRSHLLSMLGIAVVGCVEKCCYQTIRPHIVRKLIVY